MALAYDIFRFLKGPLVAMSFIAAVHVTSAEEVKIKIVRCRPGESSCLVGLPSPLKGGLPETRKTSSDTFTPGFLYVNGVGMLDTLELKYAIPFKWVPNGTYDAFIRTNGHLGWRVVLKNVPGFTDIEIHRGNTVKDTAGCTLVGLFFSEDGTAVLESAKAMQILEKAVGNPTKLTVTYEFSKPVEDFVKLQPTPKPKLTKP